MEEWVQSAVAVMLLKNPSVVVNIERVWTTATIYRDLAQCSIRMNMDTGYHSQN